MELLNISVELPKRPGACESCGLCNVAKSYCISPDTDRRYASDFPNPPPSTPILVVGTNPRFKEDEKREVFTDINNGGLFLRQFLAKLDVRWVLTTAVRCYPGRNEEKEEEIKPTDKQAKLCADEFLQKTIIKHKPKVIIALGSIAAKALLGKTCPKAIKSAKAPIPLPGYENTWVLITSHPSLHGRDPKMGGTDLIDEYLRVFTLAENITFYGYKKQELKFNVVKTLAQARDIVKNKLQNVTGLSLDVETGVTEKHPDKMTIWHHDAKFLSLAITWKDGDGYETYVFPASCLDKNIITAMCNDRYIKGHNIKYDIQAVWRFFAVCLFDVSNGKIIDTLIQLYLPDQSRTDNGLKPFSQRTFNVHEWDRDVHDQFNAANQVIADRNKSISAENRKRQTLMRKRLNGETHYKVMIPNPDRPGKNRGVMVEIPPADQLVTLPVYYPNSATYGDVDLPTLLCVDPKTKILTTDLEWVNADEIKEGQELIAFDENSQKGGRHIRTSVVESVKTRNLDKVIVKTTKGNIIVSASHLFLVRDRFTKSKSFKWESANNLVKGSLIGFFKEPWVEENTRDGGYLSGILDGEGCIYVEWNPRQKGPRASISISQKDGIVSTEISAILNRLGIKPFSFYAATKTRNTQQCQMSKFDTVLDVLGRIRPKRLLEKAKRLRIWEDRRLPYSNGDACVLEIVPLGTGSVVSIQTSTRTLITDGFLSHNCYNSWDTFLTERIAQEIIPNDIPFSPWAWELNRRSISSLCRTERKGLPFNKKRLQSLKDAHTNNQRFLQAVLLMQPEVQKALLRIPEYHKEICRWRKKGFVNRDDVLDLIKISGKKFYTALVTELIGEEGVEKFPKTKKPDKKGVYGLSSTAAVIMDMAALRKEGPSMVSTVIPLEDRTRAQEIWRVYLLCRKSRSMQSAFLNNLVNYTVDGRVHTSFRLYKVDKGGTVSGADEAGGAASGRISSCIAKGSLIECPRDLTKFPHGIPIEEIKVGQYVYSYDEYGNLSLKKVLNAGKTGTKPVICINWKGSGNHGSCGKLKLTPDHLVRRLDGNWVRADELKAGDRVMALSRGVTNYGYARLYAAGSEEINEHRFIGEQLEWNLEGKHVHHKDECKLNNDIYNLEALTPLEHVHEHLPDEETLRSRARYLHTPEAKFNQKATIKYGVDHPCFKNITRYSLLRMLASCSGGPKKAANKYNLDYTTVVSKCNLHGISYSEIRKRYDGNGLYLSRGRVSRALDKQYRSNNDIQKELNVGYYRVKEICNYYNLKYKNHCVISTTKAGISDVYDLVVEDTHCFIANQIAVHNSNPNLQNISHDLLLRSCVEAPAGKRLIEADFDRIEPVCLSWVADIKAWKEIFRRRLDLYRVVANKVKHLGISLDGPDDMVRLSLLWNEETQTGVHQSLRDITKTCTLAIMYDQAAQAFAARMEISLEDAIQFFKDFDKEYPEIAEYKRRIRALIKDGKFVTNLFGRQRLFALEGFNIEPQDQYRKGINFPIQCLPGDAMVLTDRGYMPIKDLNDKSLKVWDGYKWSSFKWWETGLKRKTIVKLSDREVVSSPDHKFYTKRGWVDAKDLLQGDYILHDNSISRGGEESTSLDLIEFMGMMIGDGSYTAHNRGSIVVRNKEEDLLEWIRPRLLDWSGINRVTKNYGIVEKIRHYKGKLSYYIFGVRSKALDLLEKNGLHIGDKGASKRIPSCILNSGPKTRAALLRGLFTADGCITGTPEKGFAVCLTTISKDIAVNTQLLLSSLGISSQLKSYKSMNGAFRVIISVRDNNKFGKLIGFRTKLKSKLLGVVTAYNDLRCRFDRDECWSKVISADVTNENVDMYDITVMSKNPQFVVSGLRVHNSLASDITLWKLWEIYEWVDRNGLEDVCHPVNIVHDSITFECDEDRVDELLPQIVAIMEDMSTLPFEFDVPLLVTVKAGRNLGKMREVFREDKWLSSEQKSNYVKPSKKAA